MSHDVVSALVGKKKKSKDSGIFLLNQSKRAFNDRSSNVSHTFNVQKMEEKSHQMTNQDFGHFCSSISTYVLTSYEVDLEAQICALAGYQDLLFTSTDGVKRENISKRRLL